MHACRSAKIHSLTARLQIRVVICLQLTCATELNSEGVSSSKRGKGAGLDFSSPPPAAAAAFAASSAAASASASAVPAPAGGSARNIAVGAASPYEGGDPATLSPGAGVDPVIAHLDKPLTRLPELTSPSAVAQVRHEQHMQRAWGCDGLSCSNMLCCGILRLHLFLVPLVRTPSVRRSRSRTLSCPWTTSSC